jgi:hypothetical protein
LSHFRRLDAVLQTLGAFNLLLLGAAAWAAFGKRGSRPAAAP